MKSPCLALLALASLAGTTMSFAASPEDSYLAARDAYVETFKHHDPAYDEHDRALADLETRLRRVIGPIAIKGFSAEGKIHLDTLISTDEGFARIDGLMYATPDEKAQVLVTTARLFDTWLRAHRDFWKDNPLPLDVRAALKRDDFYTQALTTGSAVVTYAEIPVARPAGATIAFATLDARTQDDPPPVPNEMIIVVRRADKAFVMIAKTDVKAGPIAACDKLRDTRTKQADDVMAAYEKTGRTDKALHDKWTQAAHRAEWAHPDCFATQARPASFFPALVRQAQALVDALPAE